MVRQDPVQKGPFLDTLGKGVRVEEKRLGFLAQGLRVGRSEVVGRENTRELVIE